jgi:hypothetical protein
LGSGEIERKLIHRTIAPLGGLNFPANGLADLPVEVNQGRVHGLHGIVARSVD